jgi:hypothetical protein
MGITSTQGFTFRLIANGEQLDLFKDEEYFVSDNVTGLFDLGILPSEFTRQISLPGSKTNNAFFEHYYDVSIESPFLFETNAKVPAYFDFGGIYLSNGYLQLNKVNVIANKFIDSYEVSIYGGLSSFARDINRNYLTDLTASLAQYNHTSSIQNITGSWAGNLFNGTIIYPMAEYGQKILYSPEETQYGIDGPSGSLSVQDYKPAIKVKAVWDAIFDTYGYTYSSSFLEEQFLDNVYMLCNNRLRYPIYEEYNLETYGLFKTSAISGSGLSNVTMSAATDTLLPWYNINSNPNNNLAPDLSYTLDFDSRLRGEINLNFEVKSTGTGNGIPNFTLKIKDASNNTVATDSLSNLNTFLNRTQIYNATQTRTQTFTIPIEWNVNKLTASTGPFKFYLRYENIGGSNFQVILDPNNQPKSYLSVTKVNQGGDGLVLDVGKNMPFGTSGIKQIDFITSLQRKFNLVIYPNKLKPREFIVETFNSWYKRGEIKDFNQYINLDDKIEVIPANNLAVNELNFGDTLDQDYISQQFSKAANREYGKTYYVDKENFFSQGKFEVKTGFASSPLIYLNGTGVSGSVSTAEAGFRVRAQATALNVTGLSASSTLKLASTSIAYAKATAFKVGGLPASKVVYDPADGSSYYQRTVQANDLVTFIGTATFNGAYNFYKIVNGVTTTLYQGTANNAPSYVYTITESDISGSGTGLYFVGEMKSVA